MPWLNISNTINKIITNCTVYWCILMNDCRRRGICEHWTICCIAYFCIAFVLLYFYTVHCIVSFLAVRLQLLNKPELSWVGVEHVINSKSSTFTVQICSPIASNWTRQTSISGSCAMQSAERLLTIRIIVTDVRILTRCLKNANLIYIL